MSESLDGRVAIVVGATSGMGRATAVELARSGAVVTAAGRREQRLDGLVEETSAQGLTVDTCVCDVTVEEEVDGWVEQVQEAHGRVDLMVGGESGAIYLYHRDWLSGIKHKVTVRR